MRIKFITAIFNNLYGTDLGGRPNRKEHYKYSLLSLLKMSDADFLCYTSSNDINELKTFFYNDNKIKETQLQFKEFDLRNTKFKNIINDVKNVDKIKKDDRCVEIQYSKFHWWWNEDKTYDNYYWIDAGLSHTGLIPLMHLVDTGNYSKYFESPLFNNKFLENLIKKSGDKFYIMLKENKRNMWSKTVDRKWYKVYNNDYHVIGGLFGGKKELWDNIVSKFEAYLEDIILTDKIIPHEELIISLMNVNDSELFVRDTFDTWWCPDNAPKSCPSSYFDDRKSFYKILEDLNNYE